MVDKSGSLRSPFKKCLLSQRALNLLLSAYHSSLREFILIACETALFDLGKFLSFVATHHDLSLHIYSGVSLFGGLLMN